MAEVIAALCRHGSYRQPDGVPSAHLLYPLDGKGEQQARALADELAGLVSERGYRLHPVLDSSPLLRAHQTATIAAAALSEMLGQTHTVESYGALMERSVGAAANLTLEQIEAILREDPRWGEPPTGWKAKSDYRLPFPGAESLLEAGDRCARHMAARCHALRSDSDGPLLKVFIGHGAAFRHAAVHLGALQLDDLARLSMHHARAVCLATHESSNWKLVAGAWKNRTGPNRNGQNRDGQQPD